MTKRPTGKTAPVVQSIPIQSTEVARIQHETASHTAPVVTTVAAICIINQGSYDQADLLLQRIREARRFVVEKFAPAIDPIYTGLQFLYKLRKEQEDLLELAEKQIKGKMKQWMASEIQRRNEEYEAREAEKAKLQKALDEKQARAEAATRPGVKTVLNNAAMDLSRKLVEVELQPTVALPTAQHSQSRTVKKVVITDRLAFIRAVASGEIPHLLVEIDTTALLRAYRQAPDTVVTWPGVKIEEDIQIVGR